MRVLPASLAAAVALLAFAGPALPAAPNDGPPPQVLPPGIRGGSEVTPEPRVAIHHYTFAPTGESLPYSVFVSSRIKPGEKAPLVLALRGFTGTTLTFVRGSAVDLAEEGGYILVGSIGYNNRAGFGVPPRAPAPPGACASGPPPPPANRPMPPLVGGTRETDPAKVTQYSEQDVMNVLAQVRAQYPVDDRRIYLMGHSQGGGGARHLAEKYADTWAAVALLAPAIFDVQVTRESRIAKVPLLLAIGEDDFLIDGVRAFHRQLDEQGIRHDYLEKPGLDHGTIILGSMPDVFRFFPKHARP
jgi:dienelactone hydrolase